MGPVRVCGPRPGKSVRVFLICSIVVPGTTWLWLCIIVSSTIVSPEFTRSTGGWALSNQPHWVVSRVAGSRYTFLPFGRPVMRSLGSAGPTPGEPGGVVVSVGGECGAAARARGRRGFASALVVGAGSGGGQEAGNKKPPAATFN